MTADYGAPRRIRFVWENRTHPYITDFSHITDYPCITHENALF